MCTLNQEQQLYVLPAGEGYTCWGFKNAWSETKQLADRLKRPELAPREDEFGTLALLEKHKALLHAAVDVDLGTWFSEETPVKVAKVLEMARKSNLRVRLFYGNHASGEDWLEENDTIGRIGRSCGILKIPLLRTEDDEPYGQAVLTDSIVRIIDTSSGRELYRHPSYHTPELAISAAEKGYEVTKENKVLARFDSIGKACAYLAFLTGDVIEI